MIAGLAAVLLIAIPAGFGLWQLGWGLGEVWRRRRATAQGQGMRLWVVWRDDPAEGLFRLWLAGPALPRFRGGQHVVVSVPVGGRLVKRAYSLAGWSRMPFLYCLAIRKGAEASAALHGAARIGTRLTVSVPRGQFTDPGGPLVVVAGGIGITPFRSILQERAAQRWAAPMVLHHTARTAPELLWRAEFVRRAAAWGGFDYRPRITATEPRLTAGQVMQTLPPGGQVMICAGDALTASLREGLLAAGLPPDRLHVEAFSLALAPQDLGVTLTIGDQSFRPGPIGSLLEALETAHLAPDSECRVGDCGLCAVDILQGSARDIATGASVTGRVLACSVIPAGDLVLRPVGAAPAAPPVQAQGL